MPVAKSCSMGGLNHEYFISYYSTLLILIKRVKLYFKGIKSDFNFKAAAIIEKKL